MYNKSKAQKVKTFLCKYEINFTKFRKTEKIFSSKQNDLKMKMLDNNMKFVDRIIVEHYKLCTI